MSKNFEEFRSSFQEIHYKLIAQTINDQGITVQLPITEQNVSDFITKLASINTIMTFELLESYHDWLTRED